jgi:hypothetical protein
MLLIISLLGVAVAGSAGVKAQAAPPESASYVPADSLLFVTVDLDVTSTPWLQAAILTQRIDQNLTPEQIFSSLAGAVFGDQASAIDPALFIGGEATLVAVDPDFAGLIEEAIPTDPSIAAGAGVDVSVATAELTQGYVLVTLPPDVAAAEAAMEQALASQAETDGVSVDSSTYEGIDIRSIPAVEASGRPGIAIAQVDEAVIAAATAAELESVIDVRVGSAPTMADSEFIDAVLAPLPSAYLAIGVLNGPVAAAVATEAGDLGSSVNVFTPGGTNAFTGFTVTAGNEGFRLDSRSTSTDGSPVAGAGESFDAELPNRMPADTQVLVNGADFGSTGVLDAVVVTLFAVFFGSLEGTVVPLDPVATPEATPVPTFEETAAQVYQTLALLLGVNLQTDLVQLLDGEYAFGLWGLEGGQLETASAVLISQTSDPETVQSTITMLTNFLGVGAGDITGAAGATPEATGGAGLIEIDLSSEDMALAPLSIGVVDDALIIGYGSGGDVAVNGGDGSLVETEPFEAVTAQLPAERNLLIFVNLGSLQSTLGAQGGGASMVTGGQALAIAGFQDGDMAALQGMLYIPEPQ